MKGAVASRGSVLLGGLQHAHNIGLADAAAASFIAFERLHRTFHDGFDLCRRQVWVKKKELDEIKSDLGRTLSRELKAIAPYLDLEFSHGTSGRAARQKEAQPFLLIA
ncbi:hypothetical protein B1748_30345 [Paenibacillus sp. MY03]|uniref:hypothetical protein n=1 Tax=Paenibacillus sp. MY03 TaxID=302980 RepID=UPI000B3CF53E|nr:hypothetical protein [Paenibacillus sp. MY03]OUS69809.1 hypothetical protein B1748_30345 [Paenibacillus sp. MY03]